MTDIRKRAEQLHSEARIMRLDPDQPPQRDLALGAAGVAVIQRSRSLPARVHAEDPRTVWSRIVASGVWWKAEPPSYEEAVHMAALWTVLAAAVDRAETVDPTTGGEAA